jgi:hypothetical protein
MQAETRNRQDLTGGYGRARRQSIGEAMAASVAPVAVANAAKVVMPAGTLNCRYAVASVGLQREPRPSSSTWPRK